MKPTGEDWELRVSFKLMVSLVRKKEWAEILEAANVKPSAFPFSLYEEVLKESFNYEQDGYS